LVYPSTLYNLTLKGEGLFFANGILNHNTAPHIIRPKNKKALSWTSGKGGGGKRYFAKVVHHPGTRPQPFIRTVFDTKLKDIIVNNLKRHLS